MCEFKKMEIYKIKILMVILFSKILINITQYQSGKALHIKSIFKMYS